MHLYAEKANTVTPGKNFSIGTLVSLYFILTKVNRLPRKTACHHILVS